jgi:catechol 2,3-dioxygenase-like lactoylglutathione lyase family enzyme
MPAFRSIIPVLRVVDLQRAVNFYRDILGFEVVWRAAEEGDGENAMLRAGGISLLLSTGSHLGDQPTFTGTLYVDMLGVHGFYESIKDSVEVVWPLETMDYGQQEFGIRDLDGYLLAFAESSEEQ